MAYRDTGNASGKSTELPEARVVTHGGRSWQPTVPVRDRARAFFEPMRPRIEAFLSVAIGLWPLVAVAMLAAAFLWTAGYQQP
jgi:nitrate reductase NapE component